MPGTHARAQVQCGVITDKGCRMEWWDTRPGHCAMHQLTPRDWNYSCSRAYRTVLTVLDTSRWRLACSPRLTFSPPAGFWQCNQGFRGKWDVQYVHSLARGPDGTMLVGMEFENRCPALIRLGVDAFGALVDATLSGALPADVVSDVPPLRLSKSASRWAY